jgi:protein TonB
MIADEVQPDVGVVGGIPASGAATAGSIGLLDHLLSTTPTVAKPSTVAAPAKPAAGEVKRVHVSNLEPGRLVHRVDPVYPPIAKSARISGTVELQAVIGTDGRIRELRVLSGHPLLREAAIQAVRQWVYKPPILNGASVEIVAPVAVIFRMN